MAEIRGGFSWASLGAWIALVVVVGYLVYSAVQKEDTENYSKGAVHTEYNITENNNPLAFPRCGQLFTIQGEKSVPKATVKK